MPTASPGTAERIPKDQLLVVVESSAQAPLQRCRLHLPTKPVKHYYDLTFVGLGKRHTQVILDAL